MNPVFDIIKSVHLTEKATVQTEKHNTYVFKVDPKATNKQISDAVAKLFSKTVVQVRTCNYDGKKKQRGQVKPGRNQHFKKAYVRLRDGDQIDLV